MRLALAHPAGGRTAPSGEAGAAPQAASRYRSVLTWLFAVFSFTRVLAYLPTLWSIFATGNSSQHSLVTWLTWVGANATMAAWLYEQNGRRVNRAITVSSRNAVMCAAIATAVAWFRF